MSSENSNNNDNFITQLNNYLTKAKNELEKEPTNSSMQLLHLKQDDIKSANEDNLCTKTRGRSRSHGLSHSRSRSRSRSRTHGCPEK